MKDGGHIDDMDPGKAIAVREAYGLWKGNVVSRSLVFTKRASPSPLALGDDRKESPPVHAVIPACTT